MTVPRWNQKPPSFCVSADVEFAAFGVQPAGVADLPARLGIERRLVQHDLGRLAFGNVVDDLAVLEQCDDLAFASAAPSSRQTASAARRFRAGPGRCFRRRLRASCRLRRCADAPATSPRSGPCPRSRRARRRVPGSSRRESRRSWTVQRHRRRRRSGTDAIRRCPAAHSSLAVPVSSVRRNWVSSMRA